MHQKSLTIKDTLLSSQASHPPEQPHQQAGPPRGDPTDPTTPTPTPQNPRYQDQPAKPAKTVPPPRKAATQSTLPDQPRLIKAIGLRSGSAAIWEPLQAAPDSSGNVTHG